MNLELSVIFAIRLSCLLIIIIEYVVRFRRDIPFGVWIGRREMYSALIGRPDFLVSFRPAMHDYC